MEEKTINERESLEIITKMIARTKERYMLGDGNILLLWGYVTIAVSALVWILLEVFHSPAVNWFWFLIWIIGGTVTPIMARKRTVKNCVMSYSDKLVSRIWTVVGVSSILCTAACLGFLFLKGADSWESMLVFALIIVPLGEIMHGIVVNERALILGGYAGLTAGVFTLACVAGSIPLIHTWYLPIFIAAFVCMMIIPGHIINHKAKKQK